MSRPPAETPDPAELALKQDSALLLAGAISLDEFRRRMMVLVAQRLDCSCIVIWRVNDGGQGSEWRCVGRWQAGLGFDSGGEVRADIGEFTAPSDFEALLSVNGRRLGVLRCERADRAQHWQAREIATLRRIAAAVSLVIARLETMPAALDQTVGE